LLTAINFFFLIKGRALSEEHGITLIETSAKANINVYEAFEEIAKMIKNNIDSKPTNSRSLSSLELGNSGNSSKGCC
jgi:hypothetical protein